MAYYAIAWLGQDAFECLAVQSIKTDHHRQAANKFRDQSIFHQVVWGHLAQVFARLVFALRRLVVKTEGRFFDAARNNLVEAFERATATAKAFERQALHAAILGFEHPITKKALRFERPPPADMADLIDALRAMPT